MTDKQNVLALVSDLMFTVRIGEAAKRAGAAVSFVQNPADLFERARSGVRLIILDLNNKQIDIPGVIAQLKTQTETKDVPLLGYVSHVEGELIRAARQAGCDTVLARSAFVTALPEILGSLSSEASASGPKPLADAKTK